VPLEREPQPLITGEPATDFGSIQVSRKAAEHIGTRQLLASLPRHAWSPEYYRMKAAETLELVRRVKNSDRKAYLREVAKRYEDLAAEADKKI
jgi:hypothetical protein